MNYQDTAAQSSDKTVDYPIHLHEGVTELFDQEASEILERHGVRIFNDGGSALTLSAPASLTCLREAFEKVAPTSLQSVFSTIAKAPDDVIKAIEQANRFNLLKSKSLSQDPEFPLGGLEGFPYSWPLNGQIKDRFDALLAQLEQQGITMKVGVELEVSVTLVPLDGYSAPILQVMDQVKDTELEKTKGIPRRKRPEVFSRILEISKFSPRDFLMFHLYEHDEIIKEMFEYKFGTEGGGNGYYDNDNVFELTTPPLEADDFFENYIAAQRHLLEKFVEFGFKVQGKVMQQLNMSFWRDGRNILLAETPEDEDLCADIIQAMGRMLEDGHNLMVPTYAIQSEHDYPIISPSRMSLSRHSNGRIEVKGFVYEAHHLLLGATLGAGAAYAAIDPETHPTMKENASELKRVQTCGTEATDQELPWLRHAINGSTVDLDTGKLNPDEKYIRMSATKILNQINPNDPEFEEVDTPEESIPYSPDDHVEAVTLILSMARLTQEDGEYNIRWPEGYAVRASDRTAIDTDALNEHIKCLGVSTRYIYEAEADKSWKKRVEKAKENEVIQLALGQNLTEDLVNSRLDDVKFQDTEYLLKEFVAGVSKAFEGRTSKDDGQGYAILEVAIKEREAPLVEKGIKNLFKKLRKDHDTFSGLFDVVSVVGALFNQKTDKACAYLMRVPTVRYDDIHRAFVDLESWINQSRKTKTESSQHLRPSDGI